MIQRHEFFSWDPNFFIFFFSLSLVTSPMYTRLTEERKWIYRATWKGGGGQKEDRQIAAMLYSFIQHSFLSIQTGSSLLVAK